LDLKVERPEPERRATGPSGPNSLGLAVLCLTLGEMMEPPRRLGQEDVALVLHAVRGVVMAVALGVSMASVLRGPRRGRWAAYTACGICVWTIGQAMAGLARVLVR
jgi:hypothetical protein